MKISIVTVCFNSAAHIGDALASVDGQRAAEIEHVIVDGASRDGTLAIINRHAAPWRRVISEPDRGIYDAMNKGLMRMSGEVVGFLNADDMLASNDAIATIREAFESDPALDIVYADLEYVTANLPMDTARTVRYWRSGEFEPARLSQGWMPPHPTFYVRRHLLREVGTFDTGFRIAADYDFMVRCLTRANVRVRYLPRILVRMRVGGVSNASVRTILRKSAEDLEIMRRHRIGGVMNLVAKNLRKLPQFLVHRP